MFQCRIHPAHPQARASHLQQTRQMLIISLRRTVFDVVNLLRIFSVLKGKELSFSD
jgi:hypothetical protein